MTREEIEKLLSFWERNLMECSRRIDKTKSDPMVKHYQMILRHHQMMIDDQERSRKRVVVS